MNWFTQSFGQHTVAWLPNSSFVGDVVGTSIRFLFEDSLRPHLGWRREGKRDNKREAN
jgi:hypothetical protein